MDAQTICVLLRSFFSFSNPFYCFQLWNLLGFISSPLLFFLFFICIRIYSFWNGLCILSKSSKITRTGTQIGCFARSKLTHTWLFIYNWISCICLLQKTGRGLFHRCWYNLSYHHTFARLLCPEQNCVYHSWVQEKCLLQILFLLKGAGAGASPFPGNSHLTTAPSQEELTSIG